MDNKISLEEKVILVSREDKLKEAHKRMKMLGVFNPQRLFNELKKGVVNVHESYCFGAYFWADEKLTECIKKFEEEHNALVYIVVKTIIKEVGVLHSFIYVSDHREEWENDYEDIDNHLLRTYTILGTDWEAPFNEFGDIVFKIGAAGGLVRTA